VTGGDSGIGRAVAVGLAKEGADVAITYLEEVLDARHTWKLVEQEDRRCLIVRGDMYDEAHTREAVRQVGGDFGRIDVLFLHHGTTPLIPATFDAERVEGFGEQSPMGRAAEPDEIAPSYIFCASERLSSYYTGQNLVPAGGEIHPG
jgi:NAD(P)-dependent dehydrogenase (short-subunit alcohol dehydrogenase family)